MNTLIDFVRPAVGYLASFHWVLMGRGEICSIGFGAFVQGFHTPTTELECFESSLKL